MIGPMTQARRHFEAMIGKRLASTGAGGLRLHGCCYKITSSLSYKRLLRLLCGSSDCCRGLSYEPGFACTFVLKGSLLVLLCTVHDVDGA